MKTLQAAIFEKPWELVVKEVPEPKAEGEYVAIKVATAGICGSDLFHVSGTNPRVKPPVVLGHEFYGHIDAIGEEVPDGFVEIGEAVLANPLVNCGRCVQCEAGRINLCENLQILGHQQPGSFAERIKIHYRRLAKLTENVRPEEAHLVEPMAVIVHAFSKVDVRGGDGVIVLGGGPIGMLAAQYARFAGATKVAVSDLVENRLRAIKQAGFRAIDAREEAKLDDTLKSEFGERGADLVVEAVGTHATALQMPLATRHGGKILLLALHKGQPPVDLRQLILGERDIRCTILHVQNDFVRAVKILEAGDFDLDVFGNRPVPLRDINEASTAAKEGTLGQKKVIDMTF